MPDYTDEHARSGIDAKLPAIETWPNQYPDYEIAVEIPEYNAICPKTELPDFGQQMFQRAGGDPEIFYLHGYWTLRPGEAWVIETAVPDCPYWNFQVDNWWMESMDYRHHKVTANKHTARLNDDGSVTLVVSDTDPGWGNWIDTTGHTSGTALLRWVGAAEHPLPTCRVVSL